MSNFTVSKNRRITEGTEGNVRLFPIYTIARNEFRRVMGHPLVVIISIVLLTISVLNGIGQAHLLSVFENDMLPSSFIGKDVFMIIGIQGIYYTFSHYCAIFAIFLGALSISEERSSKSLSVLLSKPLLRRDVVIGKFFGNGIFLILFMTFNIIVSSLIVMAFFREPISVIDFTIRILSFIFILLLECMLSFGATMLAGVMLKNLFSTLIVAASFYYIEWGAYIASTMGDIAFLSPRYLYLEIIGVIRNVSLFDTSIDYMDWLNAALPFIFLIVLEVAVIILVDCMLFARGDEL